MVKKQAPQLSYKPLYLVGLILMLTVFASSLVSATNIANWTTPNDGNQNLYGVNWEAQTFTTPNNGITYSSSVVSLYLNQVGTPIGNLTLGIRATNSSGQPTGIDLGNFSINSTQMVSGIINFSISGVSLSPATKYALVLRDPNGDISNGVSWAYSTAGGYTGGTRVTSGNSGSTWSGVQAQDYLFQVFAQDVSSFGINTTLISPSNGTSFIPSIISLNASGNPTAVNLTNATFYIYNSSGYTLNTTTLNITGNSTNSSLFNYVASNLGTYLWNTQFCGTNGTTTSCNSSITNRTFIINSIAQNSITYTGTTTATSNESFILNISYGSSEWVGASANLNYNGTTYNSVKTATTNNLIFKNTLLVPNALVSTNYTSIYWNISLTNSSGTYYFITNSFGQMVNPLQNITVTSTTCASGFVPAFNFTSLLEGNLTALNFTTVSYNFQYGQGNNTALISSGTFANVNSFSICINASSQYYLGYGEIQYQITGYSARRYYIFENTRLTNVTISNNLYSLETASSTPFQITATNTALTPYNGYYIALLRWYPDLNSYKVVDMGKTDEQGQTVVNVKTNDVDYRIGLYTPEGILVKLLSPIRMVCQTTPCIYSLIVDLSAVDLTTFLNVQSNLSFNPTTKVFSYVWNDPSQTTALMNLTVYQDFGDKDSVIICSTSSSDFTGVLTCDVSVYSGQLRATVYRGSIPIAQLLEDIRQTLIASPNGKTIALFLGFVLVVAMALMGTISPVIMVILGLVGLIPLIFLGGISFSLFMIIGGVAGLVLHMLRRVS